MSFTASKDDFKLYLACPRKLALKTLGFRVREGKRAVGLPLSYAIGVSGERLTEEVLEIIASLQADRSKGEYVEFYGERSEETKRAEEAIVEALRKQSKAEHEVGEVRPKFIPPPPGFWDAYHKLMEKAQEGDKKAEENLKKMSEYLDWLYSKQWEDVCKALYRAIPNEFDSWGGLDFLRKNFLKIMNTAHMFYPLHEEGVKVVLKLVMKRWESQH